MVRTTYDKSKQLNFQYDLLHLLYRHKHNINSTDININFIILYHIRKRIPIYNHHNIIYNSYKDYIYRIKYTNNICKKRK